MSRTEDLHGSAPDDSELALLIIDMISDFQFEDAQQLLRAALPVARRIGKLKARAKAANIPVIYVNDNAGRWRSDHLQLVAHCMNDDVPGRAIVELLTPQPDDYFIFKPKHSGFYATPLAELLEHLGVRRVILTGVTVEQCILFTAIDAYVRELELIIPADCVAGIRQSRYAMQHMRTILAAKTPPSSTLRFAPSRARKK